MNSYDLLIQRLDQFTRKFYLNKIIRGALYTASIVLALFLLFNLLEYYFYFDKGIRKVFFFSFLGVSIVSLAYFIMSPLLKYFRLGNTLSHEKAANIIGEHFGDVKDRLLNILQLKTQGSQNNELINASIEQKINNIKLIPFKSAIDLKANKKYVKYALPPFLLLLFILFAAPSLISDSTHRIINNDIEFERAAPFHFTVQNNVLDVLEGEDFPLNIKVDGNTLPDEAFIDLGDFQYKLAKEDLDRYSFVFKNIQKNQEFSIFSGPYSSKKYTLNMLPKAAVEDFSLIVDYPSYTGRKDETLDNLGDAFVPQGTTIKWVYNTNNADSLWMRFGNVKKPFTQTRRNTFSQSKRMMQSTSYVVHVKNDNMIVSDSMIYQVSVLPDNYPTISATRFQDSLDANIFYFVGSAADDYGIESLRFNYTIVEESGRTREKKSIPLLQKPSKQASYEYILDQATMDLKPGDRLSYYFEVFDNDQVNGSKSSKTEIYSLEKPTVEQFEEEEQQNEEEIKDELKEALQESKKLQEDLKKLREKLLQKKEPSWQEQKELEKLLERQKEIEEKLKNAKEKFEENLKNQEEFTERKEEILEKQEKIQELFEESIDQEMQDLMEQIQELMQELNKEDMMQQVEDFEMNEQQMEQEMDRLLELFKQLEVEKEMQDLIEKMEELAEKQEELAKDTEEEKKSQEELEKEQEEINEEFEELKEEMEKIEEKNEELEFPKPMDEEKSEEEMEDIQEDLDKSQEQLEQKENKEASKSQNKAAQKMKQMAGSLQEQMEAGEMEQMQEDMQALRQLLENLIKLSFDQEDLVDDFTRSEVNTPRYVSLVQNQFKLKNDFQLISDSLYALSKRVSDIESFVTDKVVEVERNMSQSLKKLEDRKKPDAQSHQRRTMTNVNDLALMLSEAMNKMQQSMASMMAGNQMCDKPGGSGSPKPNGQGGGGPMDKITKGQEKLGKELQKMGEKKGGGNSAKDFAQAAAKQAALRKALEDLRQEKQEQGKQGQGLQEIIDQMNKIERDLVNKQLDNDLIKRSQNIETRLLEADKADRQREFDNKRKAEQGQEKKKELPPNIQEYLKKKEAELELYKKVSPELRPYYKQLVDKYYDALKKP